MFNSAIRDYSIINANIKIVHGVGMAVQKSIETRMVGVIENNITCETSFVISGLPIYTHEDMHEIEKVQKFACKMVSRQWNGVIVHYQPALT